MYGLLPLHTVCEKLPQDLTKLIEEELPSLAAKIDADNIIPRSFLEKLASEGFYAVGIPTDYGGLGLGLPGLLCLARLAARYSIPVASVAIIHGGVALALASHGQESIRQELLPQMARGDIIAAVSITEPGGGSDLVANLKTIVGAKADKWVVRGEKVYTSNGVYAQVYAVLARNTDTSNPRDMTLLLVPRSNNVIVEPLDLSVFRGAGIARVLYRDAETEKHYTIGEPGKGLQYALGIINAGRLAYAAMALGAIEGLLMETLEYASQHTLFGQKLIEHQGPQWILAKLYARAYTLAHALNTEIERAAREGPDPEAASILKLEASQLAIETAQQTTQLHGGRGLARGTLTERMLRDTRALAIGEGANETLLTYIARQLTRKQR